MRRIHRSATRGCGAVLLLAACGAPAADARSSAASSVDAWTAAEVIPLAPAAFSKNDHGVAALRAGADGSLHALFLDDADSDGRSDRLLYAGFDGARWSGPVALDDSPGPTAAPQLAVDGAGRVHALWYEGRHFADPARLSDLVHRVLVDGQWSAPERVYTAEDSAGISEPYLAAAADGAGTVRLLQSLPDGGFVDRASDDGHGWRAPSAAGPAGMEPHLVAGPGGALALADLATNLPPFSTGEAFNDVRVRLFRAGRWEAPVAVGADPRQHSHQPRLAWDARGVLHAVWLEGERGQLLPTRLLHATSADGRSWSAPVDVVAPGGAGALYSPRLSVDGDGTPHLTFARFRTGVSDPRHFHTAFRAGRWLPAAEILPGEGARDSELETAVDAAGRLHALWEGADGRYRHAILRTAGK